MAEPVTLSYELTSDDIYSMLNQPRQRIRDLATLGFIAVLAAICHTVSGLAGLSFLLLVIVTLGLIGVISTPKLRRTRASRLCGPATVEFSDPGFVYTGASGAERNEWSKLMALSDRPRQWVITTKSGGLYVVPKAAVPAEQAEQFTSQLMDWSGSAYKFRKR